MSLGSLKTFISLTSLDHFLRAILIKICLPRIWKYKIFQVKLKIQITFLSVDILFNNLYQRHLIYTDLLKYRDFIYVYNMYILVPCRCAIRILKLVNTKTKPLDPSNKFKVMIHLISCKS